MFLAAGERLACDESATTVLGVGLITYNRLVALQGCVERVRWHTTAPCSLVIADDGSDDGSVAWGRKQGLTVITGERRGCAWNKNRALYYLLERTACDPILLLEDDCWPAEAGWERAWVEAAERWGHVNFRYHLDRPAAGAGTPADPYRVADYTAQCTVSTRAVLTAVGYLDTRFHGWGHEHVEWTSRFQRLLADQWGPPAHAVPALRSGLFLAPLGTWANAADVESNGQVMDSLSAEPVWRPPWRTPEEHAELQGEQAVDAAGTNMPLGT